MSVCQLSTQYFLNLIKQVGPIRMHRVVIDPFFIDMIHQLHIFSVTVSNKLLALVIHF